jgi:hypothetical protein
LKEEGGRHMPNPFQYLVKEGGRHMPDHFIILMALEN